MDRSGTSDTIGVKHRFVSPFKFLYRFFRDLIRLRGSWLLMLVFWPVALITVLGAQIHRFWTLGTLHCNAAHLVSDRDEDVMNLLLTKSGSELGRRIKDISDPLTSLALVEACITQIKRTNLYLNAIVATRFQLARQEAREADLAVINGRVDAAHVFHGVPCVIKECFELPGMPYTSGVMGRKNTLGVATAPAILQLQRRGAIVLASSNISEGCMWHESFNTLYGRTLNPYDFGRTSGGSSGGCGAAVSACMAPMAVTSDVGGSTRIPALYNGVFGHKPTGGSISNNNTIPYVGKGKVRDYCQLGPMSKHAEDLWPLLLHMLQIQVDTDDKQFLQQSQSEEKEDGAEMTTRDLKREASRGDKQEGASSLPSPVLEWANPAAVTQVVLSDLTVGFSTLSLGHPLLLSPLHPEIHSGIHQVAAHLSGVCGCTLGEGLDTLTPEIYSNLNSFQIWSSMMSEAKHEPFGTTIREGTTPFCNGLLGISAELIWSLIEQSPHTLPALLLSAAEYAVHFTPAQNEQFCAFGTRIRNVLEDKLRGNRVLMVPSLPTPAPLHNESILRIFDTSNTSFFNVMELPCTAVPLGLSKEGLPIGCQIISGRGQDHLCIAVACELQRAGLAKWISPVAFQHD